MWKNTIKKNKFQGPLPEYATVHSEDHPAWKEYQKKQDKIKEEILSSLRFMRNNLVKIADDIKVSPKNQENLDNVLEQFADILDSMADLNQPPTTDFVPSTMPSESGNQSRKTGRHYVELDRQRAKELREVSGKKSE